MSDDRSAQEVGVGFAQTGTGSTVHEGPAPADSPLGRIQAYAAGYGEADLAPEHCAAARDGLPFPGEDRA